MMAKIKTLPVIIRLCACVLAVVAFFLMFGDQLAIEMGSKTGYVQFTDALFGGDIKVLGTVIGSFKGATVTFVGYMLVLLAGVAAPVCALVLKDKKVEMIVGAVLAVVILVGAILIFCAASAFNSVNDVNGYKLAACPVVAGILAIVAALANCCATVLPLIKK